MNIRIIITNHEEEILSSLSPSSFFCSAIHKNKSEVSSVGTFASVMEADSILEEFLEGYLDTLEQNGLDRGEEIELLEKKLGLILHRQATRGTEYVN